MGAQRKVVYLRATFCLTGDVWKWTNSKSSLKFCLEFFLLQMNLSTLDQLFFLIFIFLLLFFFIPVTVFLESSVKYNKTTWSVSFFCWVVFLFVVGCHWNQEECTDWMVSGLWHKKVENSLIVFPFYFPCNAQTYSVFLVKLGMLNSQQNLFFYNFNMKNVSI